MVMLLNGKRVNGINKYDTVTFCQSGIGVEEDKQGRYFYHKYNRCVCTCTCMCIRKKKKKKNRLERDSNP